jgi:uncharacterized membrane protein YphA (DoxX/SURF4 family)
MSTVGVEHKDNVATPTLPKDVTSIATKTSWIPTSAAGYGNSTIGDQTGFFDQNYDPRSGLYLHPHWQKYMDLIDAVPGGVLFGIGAFITVVCIVGVLGNLTAIFIFARYAEPFNNPFRLKNYTCNNQLNAMLASTGALSVETVDIQSNCRSNVVIYVQYIFPPISTVSE